MIVKKRKKSHKILLTGVSALILMQGSVMPAYAGGGTDGPVISADAGGPSSAHVMSADGVTIVPPSPDSGDSTTTSTGGTELDPLELALMSDTGISNSDKVTNKAIIQLRKADGGEPALLPDGASFYVGDTKVENPEHDVTTNTYNLGTMTDGQNIITVRDDQGKLVGLNGDGSSTDADKLTITVDTTAPTPPTITTPSQIRNKMPILTGTAEANSIVNIYKDGFSIGSVTANETGAWSYEVNELSEGSYRFHATATDAAGNESGYSNSFTYTYDTTAPEATIALDDGGFSDSTKKDGRINKIAFSVNTEQGATVSDVTATDSNNNKTTLILENGKYTASNLTDGTYTLSATVTDAAGNATTITKNNVVLDTTTPTLSVPVATIDADEFISNNTITISDSSNVLIESISSTKFDITKSGKSIIFTPKDKSQNSSDEVTLIITDAAGNVTTKKVTLTAIVQKGSVSASTSTVGNTTTSTVGSGTAAVSTAVTKDTSVISGSTSYAVSTTAGETATQAQKTAAAQSAITSVLTSSVVSLTAGAPIVIKSQGTEVLKVERTATGVVTATVSATATPDVKQASIAAAVSAGATSVKIGESKADITKNSTTKTTTVSYTPSTTTTSGSDTSATDLLAALALNASNGETVEVNSGNQTATTQAFANVDLSQLAANLATKGLNLELKGDGSMAGAISASGGKVRINTDTTLNKVTIDPALLMINERNARVTVNDLTFGTATDTLNTLVMDPTARIKTSNMTLMNENILLIAYDLNDETDTPIGSNVLIDGPVNKAFDYVWKVAVVNGNAVLTTLSNISDGTAGKGTKMLKVDQSNLSAITLITEDVGQDIPSEQYLDAALLSKIFETNPTLARFFFGDSVSAGDSINNYSATQLANMLISQIGAVRSSGGLDKALSDVTQASFRQSVYKSLAASRATTAQKLERLSNALAENGPMQVDNEQVRLWVSPFMTIMNDSENSKRSNGMGALVGAEYRDLKHRVTGGFFMGYHGDKQDDRLQEKNGLKTDAYAFGSYGFFNPWYDGRFDAMYLYTQGRLTNNRFDSVRNVVDQGKYRMHVHTFDTMFSQVYRIPGDVWSIRGNLGHTVVYNKSGSYKLGDVRRVSSTRGTSQEVYSGLGVRWNKRGDTRIRVTGVYEYGYEYRHSGRSADVTKYDLISRVTRGQQEGKSRTHYVSGNVSFLNKSNWKLILSYSGAYSGQVQNHTGMAKVEYRW